MEHGWKLVKKPLTEKDVEQKEGEIRMLENEIDDLKRDIARGYKLVPEEDPT